MFADPALDDIHLEEGERKIVKDVMIGKGNNCKLVHQYFADTGKYRIMPEKEIFSPHFYFKWVQSSG